MLMAEYTTTPGLEPSLLSLLEAGNTLAFWMNGKFTATTHERDRSARTDPPKNGTHHDRDEKSNSDVAMAEGWSCFPHHACITTALSVHRYFAFVDRVKLRVKQWIPFQRRYSTAISTASFSAIPKKRLHPTFTLLLSTLDTRSSTSFRVRWRGGFICT